jgi:hypothetical protein
VRQVRNAQHLAEREFADIGINVARDVRRQALDFDFAQHLLHDAALLFDTGGLADQKDRHIHAQHLVHGDTLQIDVEETAFDGLVLPVDDHGLGTLATIKAKVENRVVTGLGVENPRHMPRIDADRERILARTVHYRGDFAIAAHAARVILGARLPSLRFQCVLFNCGRHKSSIPIK